MNTNFQIEKIKEDGTKLEIRVLLIDGKFRIDDIGIKPKGKRKFTYLGRLISDDYSYRRLDTESKQKYKMNKFISICPVELLNEAMEEAWFSIKPDIIVL